MPPPLEKLPFVSVVIACPGGSWMLDECLSALETQTYRNFEVIVLPDEKGNGELGTGNGGRSEERRVGKEGGSRRSPYH